MLNSLPQLFGFAPGRGAALTVGNERTAAVVCRDLNKNFGTGEATVRALRGVTCDVRFGELTLLVGPSGCGKTTLISIVAGLLKPTSGEMLVLGQDLQHLSRRRQTRFRRDNIGFIFQQFNLLPALTAAENAAVPLLIAGVSRGRAVKKATALLEAVGIGHRAQALPRELSGGQQQRIAIARALVHDPKLLVCDEPTASLDAQSGHVIMELLRNVAIQPDRAVIVVTHDSRVYDFGDRMIRMSDGAVTGIDEDLRKQPSTVAVQTIGVEA